MVLDDTTSQDDHSVLLGPHNGGDHLSDVLGDIHDEAGVLVGVHVDHISDGAVSNSGTHDGDLVL